MSTIAILAHRDVAHELGHLGDWCEARGHRVSRLVREDAPLRAAPEVTRMARPASESLSSGSSVRISRQLAVTLTLKTSSQSLGS